MAGITAKPVISLLQKYKPFIFPPEIFAYPGMDAMRAKIIISKEINKAQYNACISQMIDFFMKFTLFLFLSHIKDNSVK